MACRILESVCKVADEVKRFGFDFVRSSSGELGFLANGWASGAHFASGACVLPTKRPTGLQYSSSGGFSGAVEPTWPTSVGGTVADGSITWTAEAISNDCLKASIVSSAWASSDDGSPASITITDEQLENTGGLQVVSALIGGGVAGTTYEIKNTVTLSDGAVEVSILELEIV